MLRYISVLLLGIFIISGCTPVDKANNKTVTIRVIPPAMPTGSRVYIVGDSSRLGYWTPGRVPMTMQPDSSWTKTLVCKKGVFLQYKFTRGSWESEAVDENGVELANATYWVEKDTTLVYRIINWRDQAEFKTIISGKRLENKGGNMELLENWLYHPGDDSSWAAVDLVDSSWEKVNPLLYMNNLPAGGWTGIGWFRLHVEVDSTLWNVPFAMYLMHAGAADLYLNGKLLYTFGRVGNSAEEEKPFLERNPRYISFDARPDQVLAIRYSNYNILKYKKMITTAGFRIELGIINDYIANRVQQARSLSMYQMIFTTAPLAFALVHLLIFMFSPRIREHLYYSLSMICFAVLSFFIFRSDFLNTISSLLRNNILANIAAFWAVAFALLTTCYNTSGRMLKFYYLFIATALFLTVTIWFFPEQNQLITITFYLYLLAAFIETIRIVLRSNTRQKAHTLIMGFGLIAMILFIIYQLLIDRQILPPPGNVEVVYVYGILILGISVSVSLSLNFAGTHKKLQQQLDQVKRLSQKAIEQERHARDEEIARRLLEADNARKTKELEEARRLQLSMLPKTLPQLPNLDIAVFMQPATEVGGDYYDFHISPENTLTIAIGDATGHGAKAGTMVASVKSLFNAFGGNLEITDFFLRCTSILKDMNLGNLYMALMLLRINSDNTLTASAAGMPPILIFRNANRKLEELIIKGMPLGGRLDFSYQTENTDLQAGDTLLLMSDGFPELFNEEREMLDYPRVQEIFSDSATKSAHDIIVNLQKNIDKWRNGRPQNDDITFIVIKVK
ncbi:MAG TPA: SpoIIE family protein phosphatase [bacterium]|nr:SpoIIE family protein phosphatase [bacterium]HPN42304.1 SpoIIE family protein phosphatase [bacterium]